MIRFTCGNGPGGWADGGSWYVKEASFCGAIVTKLRQTDVELERQGHPDTPPANDLGTTLAAHIASACAVARTFRTPRYIRDC